MESLCILLMEFLHASAQDTTYSKRAIPLVSRRIVKYAVAQVRCSKESLMYLHVRGRKVHSDTLSKGYKARRGYGDAIAGHPVFYDDQFYLQGYLRGIADHLAACEKALPAIRRFGIERVRDTVEKE